MQSLSTEPCLFKAVVVIEHDTSTDSAASADAAVDVEVILAEAGHGKADAAMEHKSQVVATSAAANGYAETVTTKAHHCEADAATESGKAMEDDVNEPDHADGSVQPSKKVRYATHVLHRQLSRISLMSLPGTC